jgi:hypothetical protein
MNQMLAKKTEQDKLNDLIDWYTKNKPDAGKVIQVRFPESQLRKFGAVQSAANKLQWAYRGRTLERIPEPKQP